MQLPILIKTDGTITEIQPNNETKLKFKEIIELIGCQYFEVIDLCRQPSNRDLIMLGDEEGRLMDEPKINLYASFLYELCWGEGFLPENALTRMLTAYDAKGQISLLSAGRLFVFGNVIVCPNNMIL